MSQNDRRRNAEFVELLTRHKSQLFGYVFALVQNQADAEDLFQQTSLVLWQKFASYEPGSDFMRWACVTARFEVLNYMKRRRRMRLCFSESFLHELAEEQADRSDELEDRRAALANCMGNLSQSDQKLLRVCYGSGVLIKDAAAQLGRSAASVSDSLTRIRRRLHACVTRVLARERSHD